MKSFGQRAQGLRLERMHASPLWAGESFRNQHPVLPGLRDSSAPRPAISDFLCGGPRRTPAGPLPLLDPRPTWLQRADSGLRATWLGHSSVLIEIDGHRVLTDPVWGPRASPTRLAGPKRFQPAPVPLAALPELDVVVISHDHYDHLDYPTIRALRASRVPFVTSLGVGAHLEAWGIAPERITELDWWQTHTVPGTGLEISAAPSQHFSGRGLKDRNATLWSSIVVRTQRHAVFFSGDTGLTTEYQRIAERYGPFDLALLEVGAFHPSWGDIHLGPANALKALTLLGNPPLLPVHWGTFSLALHDWDEPVETLLQLAPAHDARLVMPRLGEPVQPVQVDGVQPWWREVHSRKRRGQNAAPEPAPAASASTTTAPANGQLPAGLPWPLD